MKMIAAAALTATMLGLAACSSAPAEEAPLAGGWTLEADESYLGFVTVKAGQIAEAHSFSGLSGSVSEGGEANLAVDLATVDTAIDIRNERMRDLLFDIADFPQASISAALDPAAFASLQTGDSMVQSVTASLDLHGASGEITTDLAVTRLGEGKVRVQTVAPIIIGADSYDLAEGVEELRQLANLDAITGQVPVTFSLTFVQE